MLFRSLIEPGTSDTWRAPPANDPREGDPPQLHGGIAEQTRVSCAVEKVEEHLIRQAMARYRSNKKRVARELGISRSYLYKRLGQMGFSPDTRD